MRNLKGCIPYFPCLLTENGTKEPLLCRKLCLALGCDFTYQDITCTDLSTDTDDTSLIKVLKGILADTGNITGDLLGTKLGIPGFRFMLFYMNGCVNILLNKPKQVTFL